MELWRLFQNLSVIQAWWWLLLESLKDRINIPVCVTNVWDHSVKVLQCQAIAELSAMSESVSDEDTAYSAVC